MRISDGSSELCCSALWTDPVGPRKLALPRGVADVVRTDDGADLALHLAGPVDGPLVVLVHCWTGNKELWAPVARRLVRLGHRVVLYDQRSEEHTSELQSLMRISYAVFCLEKKNS